MSDDMSRKQIKVGIAIDPALKERVDRYIEQQNKLIEEKGELGHVTKNAVYETALREFLDKRRG
jgi:nicotinamidase-related amidase